MLEQVRILQQTELATLFVARVRRDSTELASVVEFVSTGQPQLPKTQKWVLIVSTMVGCPVKCKFCDAGGAYRRKLNREEILDQVRYMVQQHEANRILSSAQLKIHLGRMGEPALNTEVLAMLKVLPREIPVPGLFPSVSSVGPAAESCRVWYTQLAELKNRWYGPRFQLQFSVHSTDESVRRYLMPIHLLSLSELAQVGERFYRKGDRKITLNFALMDHVRVDPEVIARWFKPDVFFIKFTPLNPTRNSQRNHLCSAIVPEDVSVAQTLVSRFKSLGFEAMLSWGADEENLIQTNCGQFASRSSLSTEVQCP